METKMKVLEITQNLKAMLKLAEKRLPMDMMLAIADNIVSMRSKCETIEEMRRKIVNQYAVKDAGGHPVTISTDTGERYDIPDEKIQEFNEKYEELLNSELDIQITTVGRKVLSKIDDDCNYYDSLTAADLITMRFMLDK